MKSLYEHFADEEFAQLKDAKGDRTWNEAIIEQFEADRRTLTEVLAEIENALYDADAMLPATAHHLSEAHDALTELPMVEADRTAEELIEEAMERAEQEEADEE